MQLIRQLMTRYKIFGVDNGKTDSSVVIIPAVWPWGLFCWRLWSGANEIEQSLESFRPLIEITRCSFLGIVWVVVGLVCVLV